MDETTEVIVVANSGYAGEMISIIEAAGHTVAAVYGSGEAERCADELGIRFVPVHDDLSNLPAEGQIALGFSPSAARAAMHQCLIEVGRAPRTFVHPDTTIGVGVHLGSGTIVSPGVRITANVRIGSCCLIHTSSVLSHDGLVGEYVAIAPSTTLAGGVTVGDRASIGVGVTVMPNVTIGADSTVGAGALVRDDVAVGATVAGVPARRLR